jgi:two-component system, OmpR family, response regulator
MNSRAEAFAGRYIVVADEDKVVVNLVIETLLGDGHAVFQAYDGLSALRLALGLKTCDLVISNTRVGGVAGLNLIHELRAQLPKLPVIYLANRERSTPALERRLPSDVPILREPFTAEELRAVVQPLLARKRPGRPGPGRFNAPRSRLRGWS